MEWTPERVTSVPMVTPAPALTSPLEPEGMIQVHVLAGAFLMGWDGTGVNDDEMPQHPVELDAFWIDRTEVANAMFRRFVAATGYKTTAEEAGSGDVSALNDPRPGANWQHPDGSASDLAGLDAHPVVQRPVNTPQPIKTISFLHACPCWSILIVDPRYLVLPRASLSAPPVERETT